MKIDLNIHYSSDNSGDTFFSVPSIPFKEGVYMLYNIEGVLKDECIYIGQSKNLQSRISSHLKDKSFHYAIVLKLPEVRERKYVEAALISSVNPKLNRLKPNTNNIVPLGTDEKLSRLLIETQYLNSYIRDSIDDREETKKYIKELEFKIEILEEKLIRLKKEKEYNDILLNM